MQSVGKFGKIVFCRPSYGEFWIRPWLDPSMVRDNLCKIFNHLLTQINSSDKNKAWYAMPYIKVHIPIASKSFSSHFSTHHVKLHMKPDNFQSFSSTRSFSSTLQNISYTHVFINKMYKNVKNKS